MLGFEIESAFREELSSAGLIPTEIISDGNFHRCPTNDRPQRKNGVYKLHMDGHPAGWWCNHRTGEAGKWSPGRGRALNHKERRKLSQKIEREKAVRQVEREEEWAEVAAKAAKLLSDAQSCTSHPYLEKKGVKPCEGLKIDPQGTLLVPVYGQDRQVQSIQTITPDGVKKFMAKGKMAGGFFIIEGRQDGPLLVCEGLATGLSLKEATGSTVWVAFTAGNLGAVSSIVREVHPPRPITICGDDDQDTPGNPGRTKAENAALAVEGKVALPRFSGAGAGTDFNDLHQADGLEAVRTQVDGATEPVEGSSSDTVLKVEPPPDWRFKVDDRGVFKEIETKDNSAGEYKTDWVRICSRLDVIAETRDSDGRNWGRLLAIKTREDQVNEWAMPMELLAGDGTAYRAELLNLGLVLSPGRFARDALQEFISTAATQHRMRCVDRLGWHGSIYVLPDRVFGDARDERVIYQVGMAHEHPYRQAGGLEDWQREIAIYGQGNSRLAFAISAGLAAPLLQVVGAEGGGFHFRGSSSIGKTTILEAAGSVWGGGGVNGYCSSWRATSNGLEGVGQAHCDTLLCLDEMSQVDGREAGATAYMLANGQGKTRAKRDGSGRPPAQWRLLFLSTGELSLAEKMNEAGHRARAGQEVRLVDIPADAGAGLGIFENLHDFNGAGLLADHLRRAAAKHYGVAARVFLEKATRRLGELAEAVRSARDSFVRKYCPEDADGQVKRVAARFGLVAAAGTLATRVRVLPWPFEEAEVAAAKCFRAWLEQRGGFGAAEVKDGVEQVRAFFQTHGASRFEPWRGEDNNRPIHNRAGYKRGNGEEAEYLVFPEVFRTEICIGFDPRLLAKELISSGLLVVGSDGKPQSTHKPPATGRAARFYCFSSAIMGRE